ncbi:hypothetical protein K2W90_05550 [Candidatus Babeliales bacterium]|nr:hypothetical protein [Candidatus Babeliales bacterium]
MMKKALVLSLSLGLVGNVSATNVDALVKLAQAEGVSAVELLIAEAALNDEAVVNTKVRNKYLAIGAGATLATVVVAGLIAKGYSVYKKDATVKLAEKVASAAKGAKDAEALDKEIEKILKDVKEDSQKAAINEIVKGLREEAADKNVDANKFVAAFVVKNLQANAFAKAQEKAVADFVKANAKKAE